MKKMKVPDKKGYFGEYGGMFVPELLMPALHELSEVYIKVSRDRTFKEKLASLLRDYAGRPTPLYYAENLSRMLGGARIFLKREDLAHTGSHKINNTLGQVLLAHRMGKKRVIAETGAGQHGVATATAAALIGIKSEIFMGEEDARRQELNLFRMRLLGARVRIVFSGTRTLKDAINEALRDWASTVETTFYVMGSVVGPHPYPAMVRDFQSVIGSEVRKQLNRMDIRYPDLLVACVGGGSNAMGLFHAFLDNNNIRMVGVEAGGMGISSGKHAASLCRGTPGILHGARSYILQDRYGQVRTTHSVSAGLDYPGVGPEHSLLKDLRRAEYTSVTDKEALNAFGILSRTEGIIPALESAHAVAYTLKVAPKMKKNNVIVICLSGRGDKDVAEVMRITEKGGN